MVRRTRPETCDCTSGNLKMPGSLVSLAPRKDVLRRCALGFRAPQVFVEPRHDLDEVAGPRPVIELGREDAVPRIAAGTRRSRQAEDKGGARNARGGAALDRRSADLGIAQHVKRDREA